MPVVQVIEGRNYETVRIQCPHAESGDPGGGHFHRIEWQPPETPQPRTLLLMFCDTCIGDLAGTLCAVRGWQIT